MEGTPAEGDQLGDALKIWYTGRWWEVMADTQMCPAMQGYIVGLPLGGAVELFHPLTTLEPSVPVEAGLQLQGRADRGTRTADAVFSASAAA